MATATVRHPRVHRRQFVTAFIPFIYGIVLSCYIYGLLLRGKFHNGVECDMTWSVVNFIHIPVSNHGIREGHDTERGRQNMPYRLMKFIDGRDERYTYLIDRDRPLKDGTSNTFHVVEDEDWCRSGNFDEGIEDLAPHGHIVLYIPGHEGQFHQARSLAAHGLNMTRQSKYLKRKDLNQIIEHLWNGTMNANAKDVEHFVYDVFTVDFQGEGGAYHASKLFAQVEFVMQAIQQIAYQCEEAHVTVVAHSIGGLVARMAALKLNKQSMENGEKPLVHTILTLATPHASIPLVMDDSVHRFHQYLQTQEVSFRESQRDQYSNNHDVGYFEDYIPLEISISGGLRDELIPQTANYRNDDEEDRRAVTFLATDISASRVEIEYKGRRFGMDHKAIVWCNGLLHTVREMIHIIATASISDGGGDKKARTLRLERISELVDTKLGSSGLPTTTSCDFQCQISQKEQVLMKDYGIVGSFALHTSMLYNLRSLTLLYVLNGFLSYVFQTWRVWSRIKTLDSLCYIMIPLMSSLLMSFIFGDQLYMASSIILAFVAMTIYCIIIYKIVPWTIFLMRKLRRRDGPFSLVPPLVPTLRGQMTGFATISLVGYIMLLFLASISHSSIVVLNLDSFGASLFLASTVFLGLNIINLIGDSGSDSRHQYDSRRFTLVAILIIAYPVVSLGKVIYALSLLTRDGQTKALPYIQYERDEWLDWTKQSSLPGCIGYLLQFDLLRFTIIASVPIYIAVLWTSYQHQNSDEKHGQEVKKQR